jgi:murein L,D-transpeptidase YcbB/YkuD
LALLLLLFAAPVLSAEQARREVALVTGLDGGQYDAYHPATVKKVQEALKIEGLYQGESSGKLDGETMKALGEFQKQHGLAVTGIPTPNTRKVLLKPSVT